VAGPIAKKVLDAYLLDEFGEVKQEFLPEAPEPDLQLSAIETVQEQL